METQVTRCATAAEALAFVREHGVVLASARGAAPRLTEAIIGEPIKGNWWTHARGREIFRVLRAVSESDEVLVCRLIDGKITLVHRRLWPALVRLAKRFPPQQIARVEEKHTPSGRHESRDIPFPEWVPADVSREARSLAEREALAAFSRWVPSTQRAGER